MNGPYGIYSERQNHLNTILCENLSIFPVCHNNNGNNDKNNIDKNISLVSEEYILKHENAYLIYGCL